MRSASACGANCNYSPEELAALQLRAEDADISAGRVFVIPEEMISDRSLLDSHFAAIVATFATHGVVEVPCTAVGADCQSGNESFVVSATLCCAGL